MFTLRLKYKVENFKKMILGGEVKILFLLLLQVIQWSHLDFYINPISPLEFR